MCTAMCAGAFMLLIWLLDADRFITWLTASIMDGFCCGLVVIIGLHPFQAGHGSDRSWCPANSETAWMVVMMCLVLTMESAPKLPFKGANLLPSSLLAILVAMIIEYAIVRQLDCDIVDDDDHPSPSPEHAHYVCMLAPTDDSNVTD